MFKKHQNSWRQRLCLIPHWGAFSAPSDPQLVVRGLADLIPKPDPALSPLGFEFRPESLTTEGPNLLLKQGPLETCYSWKTYN